MGARLRRGVVIDGRPFGDDQPHASLRTPAVVVGDVFIGHAVGRKPALIGAMTIRFGRRKLPSSKGLKSTSVGCVIA
jgi:hypothetical protein